MSKQRCSCPRIPVPVFHINYGRLRDIEQGRNVRPDTALIAYLKVIEREPEAVQRALS